ncbi:hypothetical protein [uncultured Draconibacterium sp.]|uniref:hypothetical protein n=1 Tax=uncultured Draconibacterium sp. TaxID=1573823 RepID=UPI0032169D0D
MKAIILISSIFYILGLKISNKIDLIKKVAPVEKVTIQKVKPEIQEKAVNFHEAQPTKTEDEPVAEAENKEIE